LKETGKGRRRNLLEQSEKEKCTGAEDKRERNTDI
jgi:hypothetical protein